MYRTTVLRRCSSNVCSSISPDLASVLGRMLGPCRDSPSSGAASLLPRGCSCASAAAAGVLAIAVPLMAYGAVTSDIVPVRVDVRVQRAGTEDSASIVARNRQLIAHQLLRVVLARLLVLDIAVSSCTDAPEQARRKWLWLQLRSLALLGFDVFTMVHSHLSEWPERGCMVGLAEHQPT